jgi:hypothetical protein
VQLVQLELTVLLVLLVDQQVQQALLAHRAILDRRVMLVFEDLRVQRETLAQIQLFLDLGVPLGRRGILARRVILAHKDHKDQ